MVTNQCGGFIAPIEYNGYILYLLCKTSVQVHHKGLKAVEPKVFSAEKKTKSCNTKAAMRDRNKVIKPSDTGKK